jgi:serine/threonine-protein kinase RsbW
MKDDQLRVKSHLQVATDLTALTAVLEWLEKIALPLIPHHLWWECQLILNEGFTNAVRHAHHNLPPTTPIDLEITVFTNSLEILIWDYGQPFNLEEKLQFILQQSSDPLEREGWRGLLFMKKLTNELLYVRTPDDRNYLFMRKSIINC